MTSRFDPIHLVGVDQADATVQLDGKAPQEPAIAALIRRDMRLVGTGFADSELAPRTRDRHPKPQLVERLEQVATRRVDKWGEL